MKKILIRVVIGVVVVVLVVLVVAAMFLGSIVKKGVETVGPTLTQTDVKLSSASISLLSGSGSIKGFVLGNPAGYKGDFAIKVGKVDLGVQPASVFGDKVHITHLRVEAPEIAIEGGPKNNNLTKIMDNVEAATGGAGSSPAKPAGPSQGAARKLQVDDFVLTGGKVHVSTLLTGGQPVTLPLPDIHFTNLGEGPDGITAGELTRKILGEITSETITVLTKDVANLGKGLMNSATGALQGATEKVTKGIGDLFKKK